MDLAFLILVHKNPGQVQRLVDYLLANACTVYMHVDRKHASVYSGFIEKNKNRKNLQIFQRYRLHWGSFNQIRATFYLLKLAVQAKRHDFISLISGQDIPIKPIGTLREYLSRHRGRSFLSHKTLPAADWGLNGGTDRVTLFWFSHYPPGLGFIFWRLANLIHIFQAKTGWKRDLGLPLYGGPNWFTLNAEAAAYASRYVKTHPVFFNKFWFTRLADEIIMQTILMNSKHKDNIENTDLRYVDWAHGPEYPRTMRAEDEERLFSSDRFIARKFDEQVDATIIDKVYNKL